MQFGRGRLGYCVKLTQTNILNGRVQFGRGRLGYCIKSEILVQFLNKMIIEINVLIANKARALDKLMVEMRDLFWIGFSIF